MNSWMFLMVSNKVAYIHIDQSANILSSPQISKTQGFFFFGFLLEWQELLKPLNNTNSPKFSLVLSLFYFELFIYLCNTAAVKSPKCLAQSLCYPFCNCAFPLLLDITGFG